MMGKPTIKGTRITVELILETLGEGLSVEELVQAYPRLTREQVLAALRFAADYMNHEEIRFGSPEAARRSLPLHEVPRRRLAGPREGSTANA
jgi:uncharacterized protein (DUF433 family)